MFALNSRKVLMAALLATVVSAPLSANESGTTMQQTAVGQAAPELASMQTGPVTSQESYQTPTNARISPTAALPKVGEVRTRKVAELWPAVSSMRGGSAEFRPLILGVGY